MQEHLLRMFEGSSQTILFVTTEIDEAILLADKLILLSSAPATVRQQIQVDLPRPRSTDVFESPRYAELKAHVLGVLYQEAIRAFASGSHAAADMIEAFENRNKGTGQPDA
jgi:NitT/TauT family transport system ATP-binding protein